jgi:hydroxyethylthiazole kinase-like uncharacterized protein yjeF
MKVSSVSEMRELDRSAIAAFGIKDEILMENAGLATCGVISRALAGIEGRRFLVFCGMGNNGGDGFVIARKIHSDGGSVKVFILGDPGTFKGPAKLNLDILRRLPIVVKRLEEINQSGKRVFSVDIPSGVNGDTGTVMGTAIRANTTVTFGLPKIGNLLYPGYERCGRLFVTHISFPPSLYNRDSIKVEINRPMALPPRDPNGHKGDFGDVLFIAGAAGYLGAPYFSAHSFLKAGGGYSRLAAPASITPFIANKGSEIVFVPQMETASGSISLKNKDALLALSETVDMVVLGPGMSLDEETQRLARELARGINKPLLIDGDGITALSKDLRIIEKRRAETILTPHLGEMSRLTNKTVKDIDTNRIPVLQAAARELEATIILKGAHSLIGYPDQRVYINMTGNAGMATAGSGDVLTGTIAAMYGMGLSLGDAVRKGVFMHGISGDLAARDKGEDGITAQDILGYLPLALKTDREGTGAFGAPGSNAPEVI